MARAAFSARSYVLNLIKRRLRSVWELDQALKRRGVAEEERTALLDELVELDILNDQRFAKAWVHDRDAFSPRGEAVLRMELRKRGISPEIINEVVRTRKQREEEPVDEFEQAREVAERRARQYAGLPEEVRKRRLGSFLLRRGFSLDVVRRILET